MTSQPSTAEVPPLLVIDDESAVAEVTRRHLIAKFPGWKVLACSDPEVAMELVAATDFSVVLCDLAMPVHNGIEILAEAHRRNPETVGILVTGHATKETVIEAINYAGVWKVIEKPWREEALIGWVREAVDLYRSRAPRAARAEAPPKVHAAADPALKVHRPSPVLPLRRPTPMVRLRMNPRPAAPAAAPAPGRARPTFAPPIPPPKVGSRYADLQLLDAGGLGAVYRARDTADGRDVALKVLAARLASDEAAVARIEADVCTAARLGHRSVVRPHRLERPTPLVILAMEFVRGTSLRSVLARCRHLPPSAVVEIVDACATALEEAAALGLVHAQLRPECLMLDSERRLKILGFGQRELARAAVRLGLPAHWFHIAPEVAAGAPGDARTDIFALGVLAHELLCGRVPDHAGEARPRGPAEYRPTAAEDLPAPVRETLERAFAAVPAERFSSAGELASALRQALGA